MSNDAAVFARVQSRYDRELPTEYEYIPPYPFTNADVELFIKDFAKTDNSAMDDLQDMGVDPDLVGITGELFRNLCRAWIKNPMHVYEIAGVEFWRTAKEYAMHYYEHSSQV